MCVDHKSIHWAQHVVLRQLSSLIGNDLLNSKEDTVFSLLCELNSQQYICMFFVKYGSFQVTDTSVKKYIEELVKPSIEYMLTLRFPSGNCPSSIGSSTGDKLVHWCHGAPGWIHMFIMAYKVCITFFQLLYNNTLYRIGPLPFSMACHKRRLKSEMNDCFPCNS